MARFSGPVGYGEEQEVVEGVWQDVITELPYFGDVLTISKKDQNGTGLNENFTIGNEFSIVADAYALEHFFSIRYIVWAGVYWNVTDVVVQRPRLLIRIGGVYNGPKASPPSDIEGSAGDD